MEMLNIKNQYATSDVYLASSLVAIGHEMIKLDRQDPTRCRFIFEDSAALQDSIAAFWCKQLVLEPQTLFASLRSLKWQLHAG